MDNYGSPDSAGVAAAMMAIFSVIIIPLIITSVILIIGKWKVFAKAGKPGWAVIIPFYNIIVMLEIVGKPIWWILLFLIPGVNIVFFIWTTNLLSKSFGQSEGFTVGLLFLGFIFYPILGFGNYTYLGPSAAEAGGLKLNQFEGSKSSTTGFVIKLTVVAALGGFLFGYDTAVISGVVPFITTKFGLTDTMVGYAVSSAIVGCIIGSLSAGPISDAVGRKRVLIFTAILFAISSVGAALVDSLTGFVLFRVIGGVGIGAASMLSPLYISEVAPAKIRGKLVSVYQLAIVIGILIIYFVNYGIAGVGSESWKVETGWRYMIGSGLLPSALFLLLLFIVPESPRWLIKNKRRAEAMDTLERLNGRQEAIVVANEIESTLNVEEGTVGELFKPGLRMAMIVGLFLALFSQITGINAIIYYAPTIFANAGFSSNSALGTTALIGCVNLVFTLVAIALIDRMGRKSLLLWGVAGMIICLGGTAYCFLAHVQGVWLVLCICAYIACFAASLGPIPWVIISEIFPTKTRGVAMSIATTLLWVGTFLISLFTPILLAAGNIGKTAAEAGGYTFLIFLFNAVLLWLFTKFFIPETKQKTLEEIELSWKK